MDAENESATPRLLQDAPLNELWGLYEEVTSALIHSIVARLTIADERLQVIQGVPALLIG